MKKLVAAVVIGAALIVWVGYRWDRSKDVHQEVPKEETLPKEEAATPEVFGGAKPEDQRLRMYAVLDQKNIRVPTTELGKELRVGPVTLKVVTDGLWYTNVRVQGGGEGYLALFNFHVTLDNQGDRDVNLDPESAYWIAGESNLQTQGPLDPRVNWWRVKRNPDGRGLLYPDAFRLKDLDYPEYEVAPVAWAVTVMKKRPLPDTVAPGQKAEGDVLWIQGVGTPENNPKEPYYLFFGDSMFGTAWARVRLGTVPDLLAELIAQVGPPPSYRPWSTLKRGDVAGPPPGVEGVPDP